MKAELFIDSRSLLGEGPCYDDADKKFYWVDILKKKIGIFNFKTNNITYIHLHAYPGAVAVRDSGGLIAALQDGLYFIDPDNEKAELIVDPETDQPANRFNDGKCDPQGRFWAGTMDMEESKTTGSLYCLDTDLNYDCKIKNIGISNGLVWTEEWMYFIDTPTMKVLRYHFDPETSAISNPEVAVEFPEGAGYPDGMTIDQEGMLWIAHFAGFGVSRWNPFTNEQLDFVEVPAPNATSCTFGGEDSADLFITTARKGMSEEELDKYPLAGGVFKVKTSVRGTNNYKFKG
ncbi:SMP-30/gluconolactonase/LRE family protein [Halobacillus sp. A5]|uniref:SMP-30/gluconolactonase/LRE family protein n=1 Tax=Halobacillus sp. A5 TaxID=2880263 RepID=UPI0020A69297|nr:SMP-30/gluconolactonase/LRE family protein [Halobacillus sp. A5]MCP3026369.1 SMP-30/gluconolactonase/LRE family protein [Halobacillus sp. A5]